MAAYIAAHSPSPDPLKLALIDETAALPDPSMLLDLLIANLR